MPQQSHLETSHHIWRVVALAVAVAAATWLGLMLGRITEVATIWPANGIVLAMLLTAKGRGRGWERIGIVAVAYSVGFAVLVGTGRQEPMAARYMIAQIIETTAAFALLRTHLGSRSHLARPRHLLLFAALGAGVAPLASAFCVTVLFGFYRLELLPIWWAGHALGLTVVTPLALTFAAGRGALGAFKARRAEAALLLGLVAATLAATFTQNALPLLFLPFAPLVLVALRFGAPGAAWVLPLTAFAAVLCGAAGRGPIMLMEAANPITKTVMLQVYIATLVVTLLPLGAVISQLRRREQTLDRRSATMRKVEDRMRQSERLYRLLAENSSDIISRFNFDAVRLYVSPSVVDVLGWSTEEMLRPDYKRYIHPDDLETFHAVGERLRSGGTDRASNSYRYLRRDGSWAWLEARLTLVRDEAGAPCEIISNTRDITRQKEAEIALAAAAAELTELAATDALTGVANRRRFDEMLDREWRRAMRSHDRLSMLLIDVDHFKRFNDHYGHLMGDTCLHAIATAIAGSIRRPGDIVARYGGEEFAVILPSTDGDGAMEIAARVREGIAALAMPHMDSPGGRVTVSIGSAEAFPNRSTASSILVEAADAALYEAKRLGRDRTERAPMIDMAETIIRLPVAQRR